MEDLVERLTAGHVTAVKVVLASVVTALALYQVLLMAVGYGWLRLPFLQPAPASAAHRANGDTVAAVTAVVALLCLGYFGFEDGDGWRVTAHVVAGSLLLATLAFKVLVVRRWQRLGRLLPLLGGGVLVLFALTWLTSAGAMLGGFGG